jgi:hypothetical protein
MVRHCIRLGRYAGGLALAVIVALLGSSVALQAATTLSIVIAGEPWKDPSLAAVGTKLEVSTPPSGGQIWLGWSTTATGAMGVNWQISKAGQPPVVLQSGKSALPKAAVPGAQNWISVPATFLAAKPPAAPGVNYQITVTPYDAKNKPIGPASQAVVVTQVVDKAPGPIFGRAGVFPTIKLMRYQEKIGGVAYTQLRYAGAEVKIQIVNNGSKPTDKIRLYIKDNNVLMRQAAPIDVPSMAPGAQPIIKTLNLSAVLPPAQSQLPEDKQFTEWNREYQQRGVDLVTVMDWAGPKSDAPVQDHSEVALYKGSHDSCEDGKLDGDEEAIADCGGSCGCCFGKEVLTSWWRSVYGFQFDNSKAFLALTGKYDLGDLQGVFGDCSILINCPFVPIPSPFALGYLAVVKAAIDGNGRCFGFSLAALSFLHGDESLTKYPMVGSGCDTWHLASPLQQDSPDLARLIKRKHLYQMTNQVWEAFIETRAAASTGYWLQQLKSNLPALLSLCNHVVVVINPSDGGDGTIHLNLYDPNVPFSPNEATQPGAHTTALGQSTIKLAGGKYSFDDGHGETCQGTAADDFTVFPYSSLSNPTMPSDPTSLVAFGGVVKGGTISQVRDGSGHQLFLGDGSTNRDPKSRIRAYPFHPLNGASDGPVRLIAADARQAHTHTVVPSGDYEVVFLGPSYMVHIDGATGTPADTDQLTIDPSTAAFELETKAANKSVHAELTVGAPDKSIRRAAARVVLSAGKKSRLEFDAQRDTVHYRHQGAAADLVLELWSSHDPNAKLNARPLAVEDGDVVSVKPNWQKLNQEAATLRILKRDGTVREAPLQ